MQLRRLWFEFGQLQEFCFPEMLYVPWYEAER
jgi:hypothetical protein